MGDVIDLTKKRKELIEAAERPKLYVNHLTGKVTGKPVADPEPDDKFGDRLQRIRTSLEKINRLMAELKQMSRDDGPRQT